MKSLGYQQLTVRFNHVKMAIQQMEEIDATAAMLFGNK